MIRGRDGTGALEDFHFREKIFHFDHERIPERVRHGSHGAHHRGVPGLSARLALLATAPPGLAAARFIRAAGLLVARRGNGMWHSCRPDEEPVYRMYAPRRS